MTKPTPEQIQAVKDEHEAWLNDLEGYAIEAIATGNWDKVSAHIFDLHYELNGACIDIGDDGISAASIQQIFE
ncbi:MULTISPECIES: hypothetical protein [unclassified Coleofasciculus]|uniref:hypothetical protein n=1 Tax=unclassified Coleofasciculus TaxID=2692782 RepID=UPI00188005A8|nr:MULTISPECIES: hypothetical protein [unclassified Coleofasciculus]MBE9128207.1 hypothetical protein [Coleofasciculus sp. LEGE 07081]MBE9150951.1 hypothetical protein [Coleofasciculus sp. LEGE 07092]